MIKLVNIQYMLCEAGLDDGYSQQGLRIAVCSDHIINDYIEILATDIGNESLCFEKTSGSYELLYVM